MMSDLLQLPLFWATLTIGAFVLGQQVYRLSGNSVFIPPILTGLVLVITVVELTGTSFQTYMTGGDYLHQMLGPVVVMLAVPMYQFLHSMRAQIIRILLAVVLGSGVTVAVAAGLVHWLVGDAVITTTMHTKSITTPVAVAVAEQVGGIPALASVFVMITGLMGALLIPPLLKVTKLDRPQALGLALGTCAHAVGTGRAMELGSQQAAYSAMAMTLTGTLHAVVLPLIL